MEEQTLFPAYIPRGEEERRILEEVPKVRAEGSSRAVLVYGSGGVGKTSLVRSLTQGDSQKSVIWLEPVDVDDSEFWLLSNLERRIAEQLDPDGRYFRPYLDYLSRLPRYTGHHHSRENVVSQLGRIKRVFIDCYERYVDAGGRTVVIIFDTVEAIRGMYLLLTLTQWMKALPATLFILAGRPVPGLGRITDPIEKELRDPHQQLPVTKVDLDDFTEEAAFQYLDSSGVAAGLSPDEKAVLVLLTRGHPLWLAFTVAYLKDWGMPEEALVPRSEIEADLPYGRPMTTRGQVRHEEFKRRLVTPYRAADFWHEGVKRLAVVRQSVSKEVFGRLMADRPMPPDAPDMDAAWDVLHRTPWIRARANRRYVTLHDAVAEELAQRIIPMHDQSGQWRQGLWERAVAIYGELADAAEPELAEKLAAVDSRLQALAGRLSTEGEKPPPPAAEEEALIREVMLVDVRRRELDQFRAVALHYQLLCRPADGCQMFIDHFDRARAENEVLLQERLALEMQRFLFARVTPYALGDVVGHTIEDVRSWLLERRSDLYLEIGLRLSRFLIESGQTQAALEVLEGLPRDITDEDQRYRLAKMLGNAYMRTAGRAREGLPHFQEALEVARGLTSPGGQSVMADAYKELGFYYRNQGMWQEADGAYGRARDAILPNLSMRESDADREEMASIQTNWAYIKGLVGSYGEATNLVESAITIRRQLNKPHAEGFSWSVRGEIYRYERRFEKAWTSYTAAENIFLGQRTLPQLGLIYQQQAICLLQAAEDGINLVPGKEPREQAERRIKIALDLCFDHYLLGYPSALNRAGRIFGRNDVDVGLKYLAEGVNWARQLSDGWYWFANLLEYAELSYRGWVETGQQRYHDEITRFAPDIAQAVREYEFPDLEGRWKLLQGHLGIHEWERNGTADSLESALGNYMEGFGLIAEAYMGSSGASAIPIEFQTFGGLFRRLPAEVRSDWRRRLRTAWSGRQSGSTLLLARLEELY
jgi:tetratricopeptide (TPR) repeat protein